MTNTEVKGTKKDLRSMNRLLSAVAVLGLALAPQAFAGSMDGASSLQQVQQEAAAQGRAFLTIEDLKTLLGMTARDPSAVDSRTNTESSSGSYNYAVNLSKVERQALVRSIRKIEVQRAMLAAQVNKELALKKAELKKSRRDVQMARAKSSDESMGAALFESFLNEANVEARLTAQLREFDDQHLVNIDFQDVEGQRFVQNIAIGEDTVWAQAAAKSRIAKR